MDEGLEVGQITQFYGEPGSGKTHLCHTLCVVLPLQCQALYIDIEGVSFIEGFREDKIQSIAEARGLDWKDIRRNVQVAQPKNSQEQELCLEEASCLLAKYDSNIKLLIVDSLMFHYRAEHTERSKLYQRTDRLNKYMHNLSNLARTNNIAVVIANQLYFNPFLSIKFGARYLCPKHCGISFSRIDTLQNHSPYTKYKRNPYLGRRVWRSECTNRLQHRYQTDVSVDISIE
ncbi:MAG: ATP-binding cassette domain-containing protein [Candidatus Nitrosopolaris sp.]